MTGAWARIIIVAYRSADHLQTCVDALTAQTFADFEVVIVDNACPENSVRGVTLTDPRFSVVTSEHNLGFSGGVNLGAVGASTEYLITLNPDTIPHASWLSTLRAKSEANPEFSVFSSTILDAKNPDLVESFGDVFSIYGLAWRGGYGANLEQLPVTDKEVFGACAAAACYRRDAFERLGGFDEAYFCYLEDVDLAFRLQNASFRCLQVRDAIVLHYGGASSVKTPEFRVFQSYYNNVRVITQNAPFLILVPMLVLYFCTQIYVILRNSKSPETKSRVTGFVRSFGTFPYALAKRSLARAHSSTGTIDVLKKLEWRRSGLRNQSTFFFSNSRSRSSTVKASE